jgi:hypothetical protein
MKSTHHVGHTVIQMKGAESINNEPNSPWWNNINDAELISMTDIINNSWKISINALQDALYIKGQYRPQIMPMNASNTSSTLTLKPQ